MADTFQPYVGPRPFEPTRADRARFFGRDDETSELLSCVVAHSTVLLYSQSGAGKTSLINAKLTPKLEQAGFEVLKPARVRDVPPDEAMLGQVSNIFTLNVLRNWDAGATDSRILAGMTLSQFLEDRKPAVEQDKDPSPRVVIFDQFEELFTSYPERLADREDFFDQIGAALENDRLLRVVFAMREDYIAELDPYLPLLPERLRTRYRIERLSEDDALSAITEPLRGSEYSYADGVAEQLVENLMMVPVETAKGVEKVRGQSVEPVQLQVVCQTLWDNCQKSWEASPTKQKVITNEDLEEFGDVDQALSGFYEKSIKAVIENSPVKEGVLRRWFEQSLITSAGTRGTVFRGQSETGGIPNAAVDRLVNQHIIRAELRGGSRWYELTHDRFIAPIKSSNERWFQEHSGGEQTPKRLEARAKQWASNGRKRTDLIDNEGELLEAERWLDSPAAADVGYSDTLLAFVHASRAASDEAAREREQLIAAEQKRATEAERERAREQQQRLEIQAKSAKRLRRLVAALALAVLLAFAAFVFAWDEKRRAQNETLAAAKETALAKSNLSEAQKQADAANLWAQGLKEYSDRLVGQNARADQKTREAEAKLAQALNAVKRMHQVAKREQLAADVAYASTQFENRKGPLEEALAREKRLLYLYSELRDSKRQRETRERIERIENRLKYVTQ